MKTALEDSDILGMVDALVQIEGDETLPKNVKAKIKSAISLLSANDEEAKIKSNRALQELDDISDDPNIPAYVRPQIWNVVSMLEGV